MNYKHYLIGRKGFMNVYTNLKSNRKGIFRILRYDSPRLIIWEVKFKKYGFDIGYKY
jgi:hypothetical protein